MGILCTCLEGTLLRIDYVILSVSLCGGGGGVRKSGEPNTRRNRNRGENRKGHGADQWGTS